jgi:riboflavin synthase
VGIELYPTLPRTGITPDHAERCNLFPSARLSDGSRAFRKRTTLERASKKRRGDEKRSSPAEISTEARSFVFSGIVEATGTIVGLETRREQRVLTIRKPSTWKLREGESISVEGVCSTVQQTKRGAFQVTYMPETLRKSTLGGLRLRDEVNLERSLTLNSLIGGHLVQGHVDATGRIRKIKPEGEAKIYTFEVPARFARYIVPKGSIAVDGISLTVVDPRQNVFDVSLLAYTLSHTTLGKKGVGHRVNIEIDMLAKYIERLLGK